MTLPTTLLQDELERCRNRVEILEQERRHLVAVLAILQEISGTTHLADIVGAVARRLRESFGLDRASIYLVERGEGSVRLVATSDDPALRNHLVDQEKYPELKRALRSGRTVFVDDVRTDPLLAEARPGLNARGVKSITVVPLSWKGNSIGAIVLRSFRDGPPFTHAEVQFCEIMAGLTSTALRNAFRYERLRELYQRREPGHEAEEQRARLHAFAKRLFAAAPEGGLADEALMSQAQSDALDDLVRSTLRTLEGDAGTG